MECRACNGKLNDFYIEDKHIADMKLSACSECGNFYQVWDEEILEYMERNQMINLLSAAMKLYPEKVDFETLREVCEVIDLEFKDMMEYIAFEIVSQTRPTLYAHEKCFKKNLKNESSDNETKYIIDYIGDNICIEIRTSILNTKNKEVYYTDWLIGLDEIMDVREKYHFNNEKVSDEELTEGIKQLAFKSIEPYLNKRVSEVYNSEGLHIGKGEEEFYDIYFEDDGIDIEDLEWLDSTLTVLEIAEEVYEEYGYRLIPAK